MGEASLYAKKTIVLPVDSEPLWTKDFPAVNGLLLVFGLDKIGRNLMSVKSAK